MYPRVRGRRTPAAAMLARRHSACSERSERVTRRVKSAGPTRTVSTDDDDDDHKVTINVAGIVITRQLVAMDPVTMTLTPVPMTPYAQPPRAWQRNRNRPSATPTVLVIRRPNTAPQVLTVNDVDGLLSRLQSGGVGRAPQPSQPAQPPPRERERRPAPLLYTPPRAYTPNTWRAVGAAEIRGIVARLSRATRSTAFRADAQIHQRHTVERFRRINASNDTALSQQAPGARSPQAPGAGISPGAGYSGGRIPHAQGAGYSGASAYPGPGAGYSGARSAQAPGAVSPGRPGGSGAPGQAAPGQTSQEPVGGELPTPRPRSRPPPSFHSQTHYTSR